MLQIIYQALWIFLIYALLGWCTEVIYATLNTGRFVNRGFLNGPVCPIYGCGVVVVVALLEPLKQYGIILFIGSFLLTSVIEFLTGLVLEKLFKNRWWDYSDQPFNIMGYVCLKFSVMWGLGCTFVVLIVHPVIAHIIEIIPLFIGVILLIICAAAFAIDLMVTVSTILKFNAHLQRLDEVAKQLRRLSDELGENISEGVIEAKELYEKVDTKEERQEIIWRERERLLLRYQELVEHRKYGYERLMKAFPKMKSAHANHALKKYKEMMNIPFKGKGED